MTRRRQTAALVASPVLVGAVTVLITIIAVFIAYNANQGLPFIPTYDLKAEIPSGAKLVRGNDVRVGGFRVGVVDQIKPELVQVHGQARSVAVVSMKLDKVVKPLPSDTRVEVRPRSVLGLKYVQLTPGHSQHNLAAGDTIPLANASQPEDLEDVFSTFDRKLRVNTRAALTGFGDAFTGRGQNLNAAVSALNPLLTHLTPVMRNLSNPNTRLDNFFRQLGGTVAQVSPVAGVQAQLFTEMADTFHAISHDPVALQQTIEKTPPTLQTAIDTFPVDRPFLADFADLSRRLRPAARQLPVSLPAVNHALGVGTPVLPQTVPLSNRLQGSFRSLDRLVRDPNTLLALSDLRTALTVSTPALQFIAPYQTVCNYFNYFFGLLGTAQSQVQTGPTGGGTVLNQNAKLVNLAQPNNLGTVESSRPWDVPPGMNPIGATQAGEPLGRLYAAPYAPAIAPNGDADCEVGQRGYIKGPLSTGNRYGLGVLPDGTPTGGNFPVTDDNLPVVVGGTYKTRQLGIRNLRDVP
jgi:virulence factor Mce-like protein